MERRTFIKNGLAASSMAVLPSLIQSQSKKEPLVVQVTGDSPVEITRRALAELGGMKRFIAVGDIVMIKPNIAWNRSPEFAATTHPDVVGTLVALTLEAGAKKVIVMDHTTHQTVEEAYSRSGIGAAAKKAGAEVRYVDDNRLTEYDFKGEYIQKWPVYRDFLEVDKFINVPVLKHHSSSGLSIAMKNLFGILGGNRGKLHRDLGYNIADMAGGFRSHLTLVDAYRIMMRNGPVGGRLSDVEMKKTVIASSGIVEADTIAARLFGRMPREIEFLLAAEERKLGEIDPQKIQLRNVSI